MAAPTNPKAALARAQVLGTNAVDTIDLAAVVSTSNLPYNARAGGGNDNVFGNNYDNDLYGDGGNASWVASGITDTAPPKSEHRRGLLLWAPHWGRRRSRAALSCRRIH